MSKLVYSTDPTLNRKCPKCREVVSECTCPKEADLKSYNFVAVLRIEKQGRGGKSVTVIDKLPKQELFLKTLCQELKKKCGAGGTYSTKGQEGLIEIQGERREQLRALLIEKGFKVKG